MITNLDLHTDKREASSYRDWKCPVTFNLGPAKFRATWTWFGDSTGSVEEIGARLEREIIRVLNAEQFELVDETKEAA